MPNCSRCRNSLNETIALRLLRGCPHSPAHQDLPHDLQLSLQSLKVILKRSMRRPLNLSHKNTPKVSHDERCLLNILAAGQAREIDLQSQYLDWLSFSWAHKKLADHFNKIASFLKDQNVALEIEMIRAPSKRDTPGLYALIGSTASAS